MTQPHAFSSHTFPAVSETKITCIGVQLTEDTVAWSRVTLPFVTEKEHAHAQQFVHPMDSVRHLVGRALVRRTLRASMQTPVSTDFLYTPWGKPYWPHEGIDFSITHSGDMVWAAFCKKGTVGIDVEEIRITPDIPELATLFHPQECAKIQEQSPTEQATTFYRCWVRKEAVLKACGKGLSKELNSFCVHTDARETRWLKSIDTPPAEAWSTYDIPVQGNYLCSVASTASVSATTIIHL